MRLRAWSRTHRYFNVIKALSQDSLRLIKDILANPHPTTPYEVLKDRILNKHSLTDFQKIERQFKIGELGPQQKLSELLAHLVELTPADELESKYLIFLFIQRLPKILQMQLGDDLDLDLRDISERAGERPGQRACGRRCALPQEEAAASAHWSPR